MTTIFATLDLLGQPRQVQPGAPFLTYWIVVANPQEAAWTGVPVGQKAAFEVSHPWNALDVFTMADLERFCVQTPAVADPPNGQRLASVALSVASGVISTVPTFEPIPIPQIVSMRQAQLALNSFGLLTAVNAAVASADMATQIEWKTASTVDQADPHFQAIVAALGWPQSQVDSLFTAAAAL